MPHVVMGYPAREDDAVAEVELTDERPQIVFFRPASGKQDGDCRLLPTNFGKRPQQKVQAFVGIERTEECENSFAAKAQASCERVIGNPRPAEQAAINGVRDYRDLVAGNPARDRIRAQPLADRRHCVCPMERAGLDESRRCVPQSRLAVRSVVHRRILPERADFVDDRDRMSPSRAKSGQDIEHRRVGVQDLGLELGDHLVETAVEIFDYFQLAQPR